MIPLAELLRIVKIAVLVWGCVEPCVYSCCCPKHHDNNDDDEPHQPARRCALFARKEKQKEEEAEDDAQIKGSLPAAASKRNRLHKRRPESHTQAPPDGEQQT